MSAASAAVLLACGVLCACRPSPPPTGRSPAPFGEDASAPCTGGCLPERRRESVQRPVRHVQRTAQLGVIKPLRVRRTTNHEGTQITAGNRIFNVKIKIASCSPGNRKRADEFIKLTDAHTRVKNKCANLRKTSRLWFFKSEWSLYRMIRSCLPTRSTGYAPHVDVTGGRFPISVLPRNVSRTQASQPQLSCYEVLSKLLEKMCTRNNFSGYNNSSETSTKYKSVYLVLGGGFIRKMTTLSTLPRLHTLLVGHQENVDISSRAYLQLIFPFSYAFKRDYRTGRWITDSTMTIGRYSDTNFTGIPIWVGYEPRKARFTNATTSATVRKRRSLLSNIAHYQNQTNLLQRKESISQKNTEPPFQSTDIGKKISEPRSLFQVQKNVTYPKESTKVSDSHETLTTQSQVTTAYSPPRSTVRGNAHKEMNGATNTNLSTKPPVLCQEPSHNFTATTLSQTTLSRTEKNKQTGKKLQASYTPIGKPQVTDARNFDYATDGLMKSHGSSDFSVTSTFKPHNHVPKKSTSHLVSPEIYQQEKLSSAVVPLQKKSTSYSKSSRPHKHVTWPANFSWRDKSSETTPIYLNHISDNVQEVILVTNVTSSSHIDIHMSVEKVSSLVLLQSTTPVAVDLWTDAVTKIGQFSSNATSDIYEETPPNTGAPTLDEDLNITLQKFLTAWPVESWESGGWFTVDFLHKINHHWLQFEPPSPTAYYVMSGIYCIIMPTGVLGNLLVITMFIKCRSLQTPANILVVNLAVSDCLLVSETSFLIYNSLYKGPVLGDIGCQMYGFVGGLTGTVSIWTLTFIALDRYQVIVFPLDTRRRTARWQSLLYATFVWLYGCAFSTMPLTGLGFNRYVPEGFLTSCSFDYLTQDKKSRDFILVYFVAAWLIPFCIISYCYIRIYYTVLTARYSNQGIDSAKHCKDQEKNKQELKLASVIIAVVGLWFVSWTPYAVIALMGIAGFHKHITPLSSMLPAAFCKTASCIDPFVYAVTHPRFRQELFAMTGLTCKKDKKIERTAKVKVKKRLRAVGDNKKQSAPQVAYCQDSDVEEEIIMVSALGHNSRSTHPSNVSLSSISSSSSSQVSLPVACKTSVAKGVAEVSRTQRRNTPKRPYLKADEPALSFEDATTSFALPSWFVAPKPRKNRSTSLKYKDRESADHTP